MITNRCKNEKSLGIKSKQLMRETSLQKTPELVLPTLALLQEKLKSEFSLGQTTQRLLKIQGEKINTVSSLFLTHTVLFSLPASQPHQVFGMQNNNISSHKAYSHSWVTVWKATVNFFSSRLIGNLKASLKAETVLGKVCMFPPGHFSKLMLDSIYH